MKVAKQAVAFYCVSTGKPWYEFFDKLDLAMNTSWEDADNEIWVIKKALEVILRDMSIVELKANKDEIKSEFDNEGRKNAGEFFTPLVWCAEARKYFDKYIPNWREYTVWDASCYTMDTEILIRRRGSNFINIRKVKSTIQYTIGWVYYDALRMSDEVWGYDPETGKTGWVRIIDMFTKSADDFYTFKAGKVNCKVTGDHKMLAMVDGEKRIDITAEEVYNLLLTKEYKLAGKKVEKIQLFEVVDDSTRLVELSAKNCKREKGIDRVWDLTMEKWHYFATRRKGGSPVFLSNCGTGNLMLEADHDRSKLFLSSLQETDIETIRNNPAYEGATVFQLDFLTGIDYDRYNTDFLDKLPERLKEVIINDEPLIFFMNPPYKSGVAKATDVGRHMCSIGYNKSAYDLFYQFCWRVMHFVEMFDLHNVYYCFFGPLTFFTGSSANVLFRDFQKHFKFIDGMCISAQDFSGTSQSIEWGIGCSLWQAQGADVMDREPEKVLLEKKMFDMNGNIKTGGRTLYTAPRERMDEWLQPKDVIYYNEAPLATSHLTFKGSDEGVLVAKYSGKIAQNALGTMMLDSTLARGNTYTAILSLPTSIQFVNITQENFWRCVSSFAFRNVYQASWSETRKWLSAPDTSVEGYDTWLANALVIFLCELKSMQSGIRGIQWCGEVVDVSNRLFFLTEDEFKSACNDSVIIEDFEKHGFHNEFVLSMIEKSKELWTPEIKDLFNWCKDVILNTYDIRKDKGYKGSLEACDAGLAQIRYGIFSQETNNYLFDLLNKARSSVNKDLSRFGFLCETE